MHRNKPAIRRFFVKIKRQLLRRFECDGAGATLSDKTRTLFPSVCVTAMSVRKGEHYRQQPPSRFR